MSICIQYEYADRHFLLLKTSISKNVYTIMIIILVENMLMIEIFDFVVHPNAANNKNINTPTLEVIWLLIIKFLVYLCFACILKFHH